MMKRMLWLKVIGLFVLGFYFSTISAQQSGQLIIEAQIQDLEASLLRTTQHQQSVFQQFQMLQEIRRFEVAQDSFTTLSQSPQAGGTLNSPIVDYDDAVRAKQDRQRKLQQYTLDLETLYQRFQELESEKRMIMEQIDLLNRQKKQKVE
ncbi:MAG: hypothetical protein E6Q61_03935 [Nitrosomonas sp.]|nr:MAG: hypothetical protein E6Q61_03935 [Nitrosomonas sp.]